MTGISLLTDHSSHLIAQKQRFRQCALQSTLPIDEHGAIGPGSGAPSPHGRGRSQDPMVGMVELGITPGRDYQMDVFYADRHCCDSTFHVETTFECITNVIIP